jgi:hypothetical protein
LLGSRINAVHQDFYLQNRKVEKEGKVEAVKINDNSLKIIFLKVCFKEDISLSVCPEGVFSAKFGQRSPFSTPFRDVEVWIGVLIDTARILYGLIKSFDS